MENTKDFVLSKLIDEIENKNVFSYTGFLKQYMKYSSQNFKIRNYIQKNDRNNRIEFKNDGAKNEILSMFPFLKYETNLAEYLWQYRNDEFKIFPFNWLKNEVLKKDFTFDKAIIENLSIISDDGEFKNFINNLIPYSFGLRAKIKLTSPYFSRDDDEFYLIQNPSLKEKVFKVPMIRGSGWKGAIASSFRNLINESKDKTKLIQSYLRIFGTGSDEFRKLETMIEEYLLKSKPFDFNKLISFLLFELGLKLTKDDIEALKDEAKVVGWLKNNLWDKLDSYPSNKEIPIFLKTHRGRVIFYPTYFNKLSLEIINPHSRKTRAGTNPIHYEVVPKGTEGILQVIYIPFDSILKNEQDIKEEVQEDLNNLINAIEKTAKTGIGAKTKLGWGQFELEEKRYFLNKKINNLDLKDWQKNEVKNG